MYANSVYQSNTHHQQNTDSDTEPIVDIDDHELLYDDLNNTTNATSVANQSEVRHLS